MSDVLEDDCLREFLNKHNYVITSTSKLFNKHIVSVEQRTLSPEKCTQCSSPLGKWGIKQLYFCHVPFENLPVEVCVDAKRMRCKSCGATPMQELPGMAHRRRMTEPLIKWIGMQVRENTFISIAKEIGVVEGTIRNAFGDYIKLMNRTVRVKASEAVFFVETHAVNHKRIAVISSDRNIVDLVPSFDKGLIVHYLERVNDPSEIKYVVTDLNKVSIEAAQETFTKAKIAVAAESTLRLFDAGMIRVWRAHSAMLSPEVKKIAAPIGYSWNKSANPHERKIQREYFSSVKGQLGSAFEIWDKAHELFCDASSSASQQVMERLCQNAESVGLVGEVQAFNELISSYAVRKNEILNFFIMAPSLQKQSLGVLGVDVAKFLDDFGRGYSFDSLRAKLLYPENVPVEPFVTTGPRI